MMVEPGDEIDIVAIGGGTIPLDLTITTLNEHLMLTTIDDFNHTLTAASWTTVPEWDGCSILSGTFVAGDSQLTWAKGMYHDLPFSITTNTSHISIRSFEALGNKAYGGSGDFGSFGIRLCADSISTGNTSVAQYYVRAYYPEGFFAKTYFRNEGGSTVVSDDAPALGTSNDDPASLQEYRADMDFSYEDAEGTFGLFSLFTRADSDSKWRPVDGLFQLEMNIVDPTVITKLCVTSDWNAFGGGFRPQHDDIRICSGENKNLGTGTNLLINGSIDQNNWDGGTMMQITGSFIPAAM